MLLTFLSRAAETSVQCPVEEGEYVVEHTVALPKEIPQGLPLVHTCYFPLTSSLSQVFCRRQGVHSG